MKEKLKGIAYVLGAAVFILLGVHNICLATPTLSPIYAQVWNGLWEEKDSEGNNTAAEKETEITQKENISTAEIVEEETHSQSTPTHTHTWALTREYVWITNGDGTGNLEIRYSYQCECGETRNEEE